MTRRAARANLVRANCANVQQRAEREAEVHQRLGEGVERKEAVVEEARERAPLRLEQHDVGDGEEAERRGDDHEHLRARTHRGHCFATPGAPMLSGGYAASGNNLSLIHISEPTRPY